MKAEGDAEERFEEVQHAVLEALRGIKKKWQRFVPVGDALIDRWTKAEELGFGAGSSVYDSCLVLGEVRVGRDVWIGPNTVLDGSGGLVIGDGCTISAGVQIYSHDNIQRTLTGGAAPLAQAPVVIGERTYLGPHTVVSRGVTIGAGCVIGAFSLVNSDIPDGSQAWGQPCRVRGTAALDHTE